MSEEKDYQNSAHTPPEEAPDEQDLPHEDAEEQATADAAEPAEAPNEDLQFKYDELEDKYLRAQAEIANIIKRNRAEREQAAKYRSQDLGKAILPALDNLERAMEIEVHDEQGASLKKGIKMVLESLQSGLLNEGITEIPALGEAFDPQVHQAVQTMPADEDHPADTVVEVLQKGYQLHDRVLRAAMVIVAQ